MRRGQIKLEELKPGRQYFGYNDLPSHRKNDIISVDDGKFYKKIWQINTGLYFDYAKRNSLIASTFPGSGLNYNVFFGYDYNDGFFNSTINPLSKAFPIISNGRVDMVSSCTNPGKDKNMTFPRQYDNTSRFHWGNGLLSTIKIFDTYLEAVENVIYDLEEILGKYRKTTKIIESLSSKKFGEKKEDGEVSGDIFRHVENYIDKEVYLSIFNHHKLSRTVDYYSIVEPKCYFYPPTKVKIIGNSKRKGEYGIDIMREDGEIMRNVYLYSSDVFIYESEEKCMRNWNRMCSSCLESRGTWNSHFQNLIDKYKTIKERGGKKPREYDIACIPGFSPYR